MENNFQMLSEYDRLEKQIGRPAKERIAIPRPVEIAWILEDTSESATIVANFLEKQDRIKKIRVSVADGLDEDERACC